jgi:SAM-dependent methyltransferase
MADWAEVSNRFADVIRDYHREHAPTQSPAGVETVVRTNTELVPERAEAVLSIVSKFTSYPSIAGLRVLEAGSGFGALGAYLAWRGEPESIVCLDIRADYLDIARRTCAGFDIAARLEYVEGDITSLSTLEMEPFDIVVANNVLVYLPTAEDLDRALREFYAVLEPGGYLVFYTANKWVMREPFTRDPLVHLLPPDWADTAAKRWGWKHNHGRTRYVSGYELRRRLRAVGFEYVTLGHVRGAKVWKGGFRLSRFFAGAAARPPA